MTVQLAVKDRIGANNTFKKILNKQMDNQVQKQILKGTDEDVSSTVPHPLIVDVRGTNHRLRPGLWASPPADAEQ